MRPTDVAPGAAKAETVPDAEALVKANAGRVDLLGSRPQHRRPAFPVVSSGAGGAIQHQVAHRGERDSVNR